MRPIIIAAGLLLCGCLPDPQPGREAAETERRIAAERQQREQAEASLREQQESASHWRSAAVLAAATAGFALIIGAVLGSGARKDAGG